MFEIELFSCGGGIVIVLGLLAGTIWAARFLGGGSGSHFGVREYPEGSVSVDPRLSGYIARFGLPVASVALIIILLWWVSRL